MANTTENNKRIAKNTLLLYFRMLFTMLISLFTSRIVLDTLGIEDYGIYNVVGGIIIMFSFLNSTLSGATSRFLTYEIGCNNISNLSKTFTTARTIHYIVAFIIFILAETIGIWFLETQLVIPDTRMNAARFVYQFSILTSIIQVIQIPYNATIISHERMNIYAYISIVEATLKLIIIYLLLIIEYDKLIVYSILYFVTTFLIYLSYRSYCIVKFKETKAKFKYEPIIFKKMLAFSGWDLYGNISVIASAQGMNFLLNIFCGLAINAACAISNQVRSAVSGFSYNFMVAVRPQIIKRYAEKEIHDMLILIENSAKYGYSLLWIISLPLLIETEFILNLWLKEVPNSTVSLLRLGLIFSLAQILFNSINIGIHATGKMIKISFITGTLFLLTIPIDYLLLSIYSNPIIPFIVNIIFAFICGFSNMLILKSYIKEFRIKKFVYHVIIKSCLLSTFSLSVPYLLYINIPEGWLRFIIICLVSTIWTSVMIYIIITDKTMKRKIFTIIQHKLCH